MYNYDEMLRCIKCGATNQLSIYKITALTNMDYKVRFLARNKLIYYYKTVEIPVCPQCYRSFEAWKQYASKARLGNLSRCICCFFVFLLISFILWHGNALGVRHLWYIVGFFTVIIIIISIYSHKIERNAKKMDSNPWRYVKIEANDKIYIKPFKSSVWIPYDMWIRASLTERMLEEKIKLQGLLYCEKCGSEIKKDDDFCMSCGHKILN